MPTDVVVKVNRLLHLYNTRVTVSVDNTKSCSLAERQTIFDNFEATILKYAIAAEKLTNQLINIKSGSELLGLTSRCLIEAEADVRTIREEVLKPVREAVPSQQSANAFANFYPDASNNLDF